MTPPTGRPSASSDGASYAAAGVDIAAGDRAVELLRESVGKTLRPEVRGGIGGFAGLFALEPGRYRNPVLATSTDGVGTKLVIAQALDRHDTIGIDLVAMVVDDLVVVGAEPLFLTDYIATGSVVPERIAAIVAGIAEGCVQAGCALLGGETAEHPGVMEPDDYDVSGSGVGIVEADAMLGPDRVRPGDALLALASSGLHSNGYSLVRHALFERAGLRLDDRPELLGGPPLGEVLLTPTQIYARTCLDLAASCEVHAFAHITGGGLAANLARVLPAQVTAVVDRSTWAPQPVFELVRSAGAVSRAEMEKTFNLGVGMVAVLPAERIADAVALASQQGIDAWPVGELRSSNPASDAGVELIRDYAGAAATWC